MEIEVALWEKDGPKAGQYYSAKVTLYTDASKKEKVGEHSLLLFAPKEKKSEKAPDFSGSTIQKSAQDKPPF